MLHCKKQSCNIPFGAFSLTDATLSHEKSLCPQSHLRIHTGIFAFQKSVSTDKCDRNHSRTSTSHKICFKRNDVIFMDGLSTLSDMRREYNTMTICWSETPYKYRTSTEVSNPSLHQVNQKSCYNGLNRLACCGYRSSPGCTDRWLNFFKICSIL